MNGSNIFSAKALGLTSEEADKLRDEEKCFKCKKPGHHARECEAVLGPAPADLGMDTIVDVPLVAKPFYMRYPSAQEFSA